MPRHRDAILRLIGAFKLVKAVSLVAIAAGVLSRERWIDAFHPANHYVREAIEKIARIDASTLRMIGIGTLVYAALFLVEGIGLLLRKVWAEYVTTIITASFIPLEVYELIEGGSAMKGAVVVANIAIVIYLVLRLRQDGHWPFHHKRATRAPARPAAAHT